jgi:16S rRNA (uracil1498-N3)-methyltransferase
MRRFYAPPGNFNDASIVLDAGESRHLREVLRLDSGERVGVFDGCGREFTCEIVSRTKTSTELKILRETAPPSPESPFHLTLGVALMKGEKFDFVVQKAVELGVFRVVPLTTIRCDVRLKNKESRLERWRKIAIEAAKQSGRARLTGVDEPTDFASFVRAADKASIVLFSERGGESLEAVKVSDGLTAIIGPEGGWDDAELKHARDAGVMIVTLGGRILRAETAAVAITALLQHRFGDLK